MHKASGCVRAGFFGIRSELFLCSLAIASLTLCFFVTDFTNNILLHDLSPYSGAVARWSQRAASREPAAEANLKFYIASIKGWVFAGGLLVLILIAWDSFKTLRPMLLRKEIWLDTLVGLCIASLFIFMIQPAGMGAEYSRLSVDPFMQEPGFFYRRILMPALANIFHMSGILYGVFFWLVAYAVLVLSNIYLQTKNLVLTRIELASLFTVGMFASTLGLPGYGEILVLGLTLLAILDFDRNGRSGHVQLVCFGLAMLAHESAAVVAFGTLGLFRFGPRFLSLATVTLGIYLLVWLLSYRFDLGAAARTQLSGGISNADTFRNGIPLVLFSVLAAFKFMLPLALTAIVRFARAQDFRNAALVACGIVGATALTFIATDYTRMVSFGTFAVLISMAAVLSGVSLRYRQMFAGINLICPTVYIGAHAGIWPYQGLYGFVLTHLLGIHG